MGVLKRAYQYQFIFKYVVGGVAQPSFLHKALDIYLKHFMNTNNTTNKIISHILLADASC